MNLSRANESSQVWNNLVKSVTLKDRIIQEKKKSIMIEGIKEENIQTEQVANENLIKAKSIKKAAKENNDLIFKFLIGSCVLLFLIGFLFAIRVDEKR